MEREQRGAESMPLNGSSSSLLARVFVAGCGGSLRDPQKDKNFPSLVWPLLRFRVFFPPSFDPSQRAMTRPVARSQQARGECPKNTSRKQAETHLAAKDEKGTNQTNKDKWERINGTRPKQAKSGWRHGSSCRQGKKRHLSPSGTPTQITTVVFVLVVVFVARIGSTQLSPPYIPTAQRSYTHTTTHFHSHSFIAR